MNTVLMRVLVIGNDPMVKIVSGPKAAIHTHQEKSKHLSQSFRIYFGISWGEILKQVQDDMIVRPEYLCILLTKPSYVKEEDFEGLI